MADTFKTLGQSAPAAATLTDLYTVPASTSTVCAYLQICNYGTAAIKFRVTVAPAGAGDAVAHRQHFDESLAPNTPYRTLEGATLATTDKVRVYSDLATTAFTLYGVEVT